jgi:hypothetical protein
MNSKIITGGLAIVGATALLKEAATAALDRFVNNIEYTTGKAKTSLNQIGQGKVGVIVPVTILNGNSVSFTIDRFLGTVHYGNVFLSNIAINNPFTLTPGAAIEISLEFTVDISTTVNGVYSAAQAGFSSLLEKINLEGHIYLLSRSFVGQIKIPISQPIDILP